MADIVNLDLSSVAGQELLSNQFNQLESSIGALWNGREIDANGIRYRVEDTGRGTRVLRAIGAAEGSKPPTAEELIGKQMDKIKEQVSFLKDFQTKNPFVFDEALARQMATNKYKPYYTEVLSDFIKPLKDVITRSAEDENKLLGEMTRQKNVYTDKFNRDLDDAINLASEGYAGAGLLDSGVANRALGRTKIDAGNTFQDFLDTSKFKEDTVKTQAARLRSDTQDQIAQKERDIMGTGRALDTNIAQDVEAQRGTAQRQYGTRLLDAVTSRFGAPLTNIDQFLKI